jgi:hypothetical protein
MRLKLVGSHFHSIRERQTDIQQRERNKEGDERDEQEIESSTRFFSGWVGF